MMRDTRMDMGTLLNDFFEKNVVEFLQYQISYVLPFSTITNGQLMIVVDVVLTIVLQQKPMLHCEMVYVMDVWYMSWMYRIKWVVQVKIQFSSGCQNVTCNPQTLSGFRRSSLSMIKEGVHISLTSSILQIHLPWVNIYHKNLKNNAKNIKNV